jgi:hypothetical protein
MADKTVDHPATQAIVRKWQREEKEKAKKKDTIVVIQYGTGKTIWLPQSEALYQIMMDFDYIEQIYYAEKG